MSKVHQEAQAARELIKEIKILDAEIKWDEAMLTAKMADRIKLNDQLNELYART